MERFKRWGGTLMRELPILYYYDKSYIINNLCE
jgi:hypothetical protein